jgi:hypothetical protein
MSALTRRALRQQRKRDLDSQTARAVVEAMRSKGVALFATNLPNSVSWELHDGTPVTEAVAKLVLANPHVAGVGDCLIGDRRASQTFRYHEQEEAPTN